MRPRVLLCRPRPEGDATARRLEALGYEPVLAPVLAIAPLALALPQNFLPDAIAVTSAHAVAHLPPSIAAALGAVPLFAVGAATASAARAAGFASVTSSAADASALAGTLLATLTPGAQVLFLAGRPRKDTLEAAFANAGRALLVLESYEARALTWTPDAVATLRARPAAAALHFSRRSATLALAASAAAGLRPEFGALHHCCLSEDVASALRGQVTGSVAVADAPGADSVLQVLARILPS